MPPFGLTRSAGAVAIIAGVCACKVIPNNTDRTSDIMDMLVSQTAVTTHVVTSSLLTITFIDTKSNVIKAYLVPNVVLEVADTSLATFWISENCSWDNCGHGKNADSYYLGATVRKNGTTTVTIRAGAFSKQITVTFDIVAWMSPDHAWVPGPPAPAQHELPGLHDMALRYD